MFKKFKRKKVEKQDDTLPINIEQLIEKYNLNNLWQYVDELVDYINKLLFQVVTNTSGTAIKLADGTLIQYGEISMTTGTASTTVAGNAMYRAPNYELTYPASFVSEATVECFIQMKGGQANSINTITINPDTKYIATIRWYSTISNYTRPFAWMAIGRWK